MTFTKLAAAAIAEKRKERGMTKSEFARRIGKTNQTVDNIEKGKGVRSDIYDKAFEELSIKVIIK